MCIFVLCTTDAELCEEYKYETHTVAILFVSPTCNEGLVKCNSKMDKKCQDEHWWTKVLVEFVTYSCRGCGE